LLLCRYLYEIIMQSRIAYLPQIVIYGMMAAVGLTAVLVNTINIGHYFFSSFPVPYPLETFVFNITEAMQFDILVGQAWEYITTCRYNTYEWQTKTFFIFSDRGNFLTGVPSYYRHKIFVVKVLYFAEVFSVIGNIKR